MQPLGEKRCFVELCRDRGNENERHGEDDYGGKHSRKPERCTGLDIPMNGGTLH